jgi:hypothetical protein
MNIDDVLFGVIVCGIGLAGACFRSEYVHLRELRAIQRRKERIMHMGSLPSPAESVVELDQREPLVELRLRKIELG